VFVLSDNAATVNVPNEYLYDLPSRQDVHGAIRPRGRLALGCLSSR